MRRDTLWVAAVAMLVTGCQRDNDARERDPATASVLAAIERLQSADRLQVSFRTHSFGRSGTRRITGRATFLFGSDPARRISLKLTAQPLFSTSKVSSRQDLIDVDGTVYLKTSATAARSRPWRQITRHQRDQIDPGRAIYSDPRVLLDVRPPEPRPLSPPCRPQDIARINSARTVRYICTLGQLYLPPGPKLERFNRHTIYGDPNLHVWIDASNNIRRYEITAPQNTVQFTVRSKLRQPPRINPIHAPPAELVARQ